MSSNHNNSKFRTPELGLAAYLAAEGYRWDQVEIVDRVKRSCEWVFSADADLHECVDDYRAGLATVEPKQFNGCLVKARNALFATLDGASH